MEAAIGRTNKTNRREIKIRREIRGADRGRYRIIWGVLPIDIG